MRHDRESLASRVCETYGRDAGGVVWRQVRAGVLSGPRLRVGATCDDDAQDELRAAWDRAWLMGAVPAPVASARSARRVLRVVDLFAGCGAMSLGLRMAAEAVGLGFEPVVAADFVKAALDVYRTNLRPRVAFDGDLSDAVKCRMRSGRLYDARVAASLTEHGSGADVLIGGPPCQGHSDLNNHSRRDDPKNSLYLVMPAVALALQPRVVIIENVPSVVHDRGGVVAATVQALEASGYGVTLGTLHLVQIGVPQRRRRHFLMAVRRKKIEFESIVGALRTSRRTVAWAIGDLAGLDSRSDSTFDSASVQTERNRRRLDWLFEHESFDLPNSQRPPCHREKKHSYVSMYGRMRWEEPAQTITSGFGSPGQGRYVHPAQRRTLTPHEAARLQFFPDSYLFTARDRSLRRSELAQMIGNAVPPKATYALGLAAISAISGSLLPDNGDSPGRA